jgi:hypothetical protein
VLIYYAEELSKRYAIEKRVIAGGVHTVARIDRRCCELSADK